MCQYNLPQSSLPILQLKQNICLHVCTFYAHQQKVILEHIEGTGGIKYVDAEEAKQKLLAPQKALADAMSKMDSAESAIMIDLLKKTGVTTGVALNNLQKERPQGATTNVIVNSPTNNSSVTTGQNFMTPAAAISPESQFQPALSGVNTE